MISVVSGQTFTATATGASTGLTGIIGVAIEDGEGTVITPRTTAGIVEINPGVYAKDDLVAPPSGYYVLVWDDGSVFAPEELRVTGALAATSTQGAGFIQTPCLIVRRSVSGSTDDYGNDIPTEEVAETVCELQQQSRAEPSGEGQVSLTLWNLFFPVNTDLGTDDAVVVEGAEYELVGDPWNANQGSPAVQHVAATARLVAGAGDSS